MFNHLHSIRSFSFLRFSIIWHFLHAAASKMSIWYVFIHFKVVSGWFTVYDRSAKKNRPK